MRAVLRLPWALVALAASADPGRVLWREARHGMTKGGLTEVFKGLVPDNSMNLVPCFLPAEFRLPGVQMYGTSFQAWFLFNRRQRLYAVDLRTEGTENGPEARELFNTLCKELMAAHGDPAKVLKEGTDKVQYDWPGKDGYAVGLKYAACASKLKVTHYVALSYAGPYQF